MAYNHRRAEIEWLNWKEKEEKQPRELGVDEDTIQRLHTYDWQQFNKERQYQQRWRDELEEIEQQEEQLPPVRTMEDLLDEIGNEQLFDILRKADKLTLEILLMRMEGYSDSEIAHMMDLDKYAVSMRIYRLRKKLKKYFLRCVIFCPFSWATK